LFGALTLLGGPAGSLALDTGAVRGAGQSVAAAAPVDATVQGANPHGEGTVLGVTIGGQEAVVVGRSRGEKKPDGYHGHTTTLAILGNDVIANDTGPGQTAKGPLAPLQEQVLDQVCKGSNGNLCADVLRADSATTATGSTNHSRLAGLAVGGDKGVVAVAGDSNGNIQSSGDCQTAHGDVTLLKLMLGGNPLLDIGESASDSNACPSGTTVKNSSNPLVAIGGQEVPLPGCGANAPGNLIDVAPLVTIACNAGSQAGVGTIANAALAGTVVQNGDTPLGSLTGAGTGAGATAAPAQAVLGDRTASPKAPSAGTRGSSKRARRGPTSGPPAAARKTRSLPAAEAGRLPYTGSDVLILLMTGAVLLATGLTIRERSARAQRAA
jgi:hypothetical protein